MTNTNIMDTKLPWQTQASKMSLMISLTLFIFTLSSLILGFFFSFLLNKLNYTNWIISQETWKILAVISLLIFILISICLYFSEKWIDSRIKKTQQAVGKNLLLTLSIILALSLLIITYYGFSLFFTFLYNQYWV